MLLNGKELILDENNDLPEITGVKVEENITLTPGTCAFILL